MTSQDKLIALLKEFKQLEIERQIDFDKFYLYSLITTSSAIEGSTVTEVENQLLFDEGIPAKGKSMAEQLMNLDLKAAYEQCLKYVKAKEDYSIDMLKHLASILMKNTGSTYNTALGDFSSADGDLRLLNVTAGTGGKSYMNYSKVPTKLQELCASINERRKNIDRSDVIACYNLSFDFHFFLVTIHPWADGNGRMSRLVMNELQFEMGIISTIINKDSKAEYIEALIATREADDINIFREFMIKHHSKNIERMISEHKNSQRDDISIDVPVNVPVNFSEREKLIIEAMKINSSVTVKELSEKLNVSDKTIKRDIASLKERNIIKRIGSDKNGEWIVY